MSYHLSITYIIPNNQLHFPTEMRSYYRHCVVFSKSGFVWILGGEPNRYINRDEVCANLGMKPTMVLIMTTHNGKDLDTIKMSSPKINGSPKLTKYDELNSITFLLYMRSFYLALKQPNSYYSFLEQAQAVTRQRTPSTVHHPLLEFSVKQLRLTTLSLSSEALSLYSD